MLLLRWLLNALALLAVSYLVPGFVVDSLYAAFITALVLGLVNATIRPILLLLTLPINLLSLGLFTLVINAFMILFVATIVKGFDVVNFTAAFWAGIVLWLISLLTNVLIDAKD